MSVPSPRPTSSPLQVRIVNRHHRDDPDLLKGTYVGRGTPLGNPFEIGRDGTREQVIARYRVWLRGIAKRGARGESTPEYRELLRLAQLARIQPIALVCSCAPLPCHAEAIRDAIYYLHGVPNPEPSTVRVPDSALPSSAAGGETTVPTVPRDDVDAQLSLLD